jgi:hypothetical protein
MRTRADSLRAMRAALVLVLGALSVSVPACSTEPNTIALLGEPVGEPDAGKKPEPTTCSVDQDCSTSHPFCSQGDHRCVECLSATQCPQGYRCAGETHTCEPPCKSPSDCAGIDRQFCSATGVCVQCEADGDCDGMPLTPHCNLRNGLCVRCLVQSDCGLPICIDDCFACMNNACVWRT